jgi:hypothetical protein
MILSLGLQALAMETSHLRVPFHAPVHVVHYLKPPPQMQKKQRKLATGISCRTTPVRERPVSRNIDLTVHNMKRANAAVGARTETYF